MIDWGEIDKERYDKYLFTTLPDTCDYKIETFELGKVSEIDNETAFKSTFRVNTKTEEDVYKWIQDFYKASSTTYNSFKGDRIGTRKKCIISGK